MKPMRLSEQARIIERQERALDDIELAHEKEGYVPSEPFVALLPVDDILGKAEAMLEGVIGKQ